MRKIFFLLSFVALPVSAQDTSLWDAEYAICTGKAQVDSYYFTRDEMDELRQQAEYREQARRHVRRETSLDWYSLTPDEQCQAANTVERNARVTRYFEKQDAGIY